MQSCQLSLENWKNSTAWPTRHNIRVAQIRLPEDGITLKVWQTATLQPFDLQRLAVPPLKDLELLKNILPAHKTSRIFKMNFVLSKWLHFHSAYLVGVSIFSFMTVNNINGITLKDLKIFLSVQSTFLDLRMNFEVESLYWHNGEY